MMTARGRWMALPGLVGLFLGVLRGQAELSLLSLSVLVWLAAEWALFSWRVWVELPRVQIERTVNGRSDPTGLLWAGRTVTITVRWHWWMITALAILLAASIPALLIAGLSGR